MYQRSDIIFINAKINLGLHILSRRPDGYHNLQSIFYPVGLYNGTPRNTSRFCDVMEVSTTDKASTLSLRGLSIDGATEKNLVWKAIHAFTCRYEQINKQGAVHVDVTLEKNLPMQAGLGGGSADAAFILSHLNNLHGNPFTDAQLNAMAASIGADCPFFLYNKPALAEGIGERLTPLSNKLEGKWCAIIKPGESMSTAKAFSLIKPNDRHTPLQDIYAMSVEEWPMHLSNDFEKPFLHLFPHLRDIKTSLYECGALYASLSGSGSSFYGIYSAKEDAEYAIRRQCNEYFKAVCLL